MFKKVLNVIVVGILILYFIFFLYHSIVYIIYPYDLDNEEGFILNQTRLLAQGNTIYTELNEYPYTVGNYPPVFQFICIPLTWIFGNTHAIGRSISVLSTLLVGFIIFLLVKQQSGSMNRIPTAAIIAGLFPFSTHYFYRWAPYNRVDMLALLFALLGIYFIQKLKVRGLSDETLAQSGQKLAPTKSESECLLPTAYRLLLTASCLLFVLAFYTKQNMVAAPIAAAIYLLIKDKKQAGILVLGYLVGIIAIFLIGNAITNGQFYRHLFLYNLNPFSWFTVWLYARNLLWFYPIFIILVLIAIFSQTSPKLRQVNRKTNLLFSLYFICSVVVALSCGKYGSAVNYLLELIVAGSILLGVTLNQFRTPMQSGQVSDFTPKDSGFGLRISKPIIIYLFLILQLVMIWHIPYGLEYGETPTQKDWFYAKETEKYIQQTPGLILSDDIAMLVRNQRPVLFQPFIMSTLARQGLWNQTPVVNDLNQQKFELLVLYFDASRNPDLERYTEQMLTAIKTNYHLIDHLGKYWIYSRGSKS